MGDFRYDPSSKAIVEVVEQVADDSTEAKLQAEADQLQNVVNAANEVLQGKIEAVAAAQAEVEVAQTAVTEAEEALTFQSNRRNSWQEAVRVQQELAQSSPTEENATSDDSTDPDTAVDEDAEATEAVDVPTHVATNAPA